MKNKKNKKHNKKYLLFFALLFVLLEAASFITYCASYRSSQNEIINRDSVQLNFQGEKNNLFDLVVLGDSLSYSSFSTITLWQDRGISAYVLGIPGEKITEAKRLLAEAMQTQTPKAIVLETNLLYRKLNQKSVVRNDMLEKFQRSFLIFQYHNCWKQLLHLRGGSDYFAYYRGYRAYTQHEPVEDISDYMKESSREKKIERVNLKVFDEIVQMCREKDLPLILYSAPSPKCYSMSKHNRIQALADQYGLTYVDLNLSAEEMGIDWERDFRDGGDHLNEYGAPKAMKVLEKTLDALNLPDRRGDSDQQEWDERVNEYTQRFKDREKAEGSPEEETETDAANKVPGEAV